MVDEMAILRRAWHAIRCPHHGRFCPGRTCCCRDLHYRPLRFRRDMAAVENGSPDDSDPLRQPDIDLLWRLDLPHPDLDSDS